MFHLYIAEAINRIFFVLLICVFGTYVLLNIFTLPFHLENNWINSQTRSIIWTYRSSRNDIPFFGLPVINVESLLIFKFNSNENSSSGALFSIAGASETAQK